MCVIVVKCKGSDFAPLDAVEKCIQHNPHGFAFAWNEQGELKTYKTMNPTEAMAKYKSLSETLNPAETALIFHARIQTHGSQRVENCHGFTHGNIAFFHNGVLHIKNRDDMTDSETFFRDFFVPAMEGVSFEFAMKMSRAVIGDTNNKFAVIDNNGNISFTSGSCGYDKIQFPGYKGKIYFSNLHWMPVSNFARGLGVDPYADAKKPSVGKTAGENNKPTGSSLKVGERKRAAPKEPLAVSKSPATALIDNLFGDALEERYQALTAKA